MFFFNEIRMMKEKSLFLIRGLPGSGKTTICNVLSEGGKYPCYSVDDFFTDATNGQYTFEFDKNHLAYKQCEENTKDSMEAGIEKIFVHNTFTMEWEIKPYFNLAQAFGYTVFVLTAENYHASKNTHAVNDEQIKKMAEKYKVKLF